MRVYVISKSCNDSFTIKACFCVYFKFLKILKISYKIYKETPMLRTKAVISARIYSSTSYTARSSSSSSDAVQFTRIYISLFVFVWVYNRAEIRNIYISHAGQYPPFWGYCQLPYCMHACLPTSANLAIDNLYMWNATFWKQGYNYTVCTHSRH
jgi:hypothetical protein